jgi:iron complex outermembrane recepter protein
MLTIAASAALAGPASSRLDSPPVEIRIQPGPLEAALSQWADQTGMRYFKNGNLGRAADSPGASGSLSPREALGALLSNTGLTFIVINDRTIRIVPLQSAESHPDGSAAGTPGPKELDEVVVTGSHIPGTYSVSPLRVFSREDIDWSGAANAEEFVALLTQSYTTGPTEFGGLRTLGTGPVPANPGFGTGANLRGLGASSTLVLVNGHRMAHSGYDDFVDVSMIPSDAIERVEVLTDGASAIYGSDAVGGVVNFLLRHDYATTESALRVGTSTHADARSYDAWQAAGTQWNSGGAMLSLQWQGRGPVGNQDRDFSRRDTEDLLYGPRDLVPRMIKDAIYGSLDQGLAQGIDISAQAFYTKRREIYHGCNAPCEEGSTDRLYDQHATNSEYETAVTLSLTLTPSWKLELTADSSQNRVSSEPIFQPMTSAPTDTGSDLWSFGASSTGALYELPAGEIEASLGASHRSESFRLANPLGAFRSQSEVEAGYAELQIPVIGPAPPVSVDPRMVVTVAGRYEHYSTFGSTFNPKVGIRVTATPELSVRGSYSSAFKAPTAYQLSEFNADRYLQPLPDVPVGKTLSLIRHGGNPNLRDQTADVWTFGIDWDSPSPGLHATLTYFNVDYKHIIWDPSTVPSAWILTSPAYSDYVLRRSPADAAAFNSLAESLIGTSRLVGCTPPSAGACAEAVTDIGAIIDQRQANLAATHTSGIDSRVEQTFSLAAGRLTARVDLTHLIDYRQRVTPASDAVEIANTAGNPPRTQLRTEAQWDWGNWAAGTTLNFASGYSTRGSQDAFGNPLPQNDIAAWTTFDLHLGYSLGGLRVLLNITNLFDKQPPHVNDLAYGLGYDPANANPFGRLVSVQVRKVW